MTKKIVGTTSATEQAKVIMGGYNEKMSRAREKLNDLKIGFFNLIEPIAPVTQGFFKVIETAGKVAVATNALSKAFSVLNIRATINTIKILGNTVAIYANVAAKKIATIASKYGEVNC